MKFSKKGCGMLPCKERHCKSIFTFAFLMDKQYKSPERNI